MASALSPSPAPSSASSSNGNGPSSVAALLRSPRSLLPPLSSFFVLANYFEFIKLAAQPVLFFLALPWLLAIGAVRYYLLGGAAEGRQMAAQMESIMARKLERMNAQLSLMPAMTSQVSTSSRMLSKNVGGDAQPFASSFVDTAPGVKIHLVTGGNFASSKPILLFVHGFPESWVAWEEQLVYFARIGFPVAAIDLRSYGRSSAPQDIASYSMRTLVGDVIGVIAHLRKISPDKEVVLCGHDWGAIIAWNTAFVEANENVKAISKYVIMNAPHPAHFTLYSLSLDRFQFLRSWYILWFQVPFAPEFFMFSAPRRFPRIFPESDREIGVATAANRAIGVGMVNYYRAAVRDAMAGRSMKPIPLRKPLLHLWGEKDTALGSGLATTLPLSRWAPHAHTRVKVFAGASHWIVAERSKEVSEAILKFVQEE